MSDHPLLDIQRLDTEAEQLRRRHETLPQRAELESAKAEPAALAREIELIAVARIEVATRQRRHEDEAQIFSDKADEGDKRLYSGDVGMRDLQPLQDEIARLRARQGALEDLALEAMEEAEELAGCLAQTEQTQEEVRQRIAGIEAELAAAEAEIGEERARVDAARREAAAQVSADDFARYEQLRPGFGSATVVRFDGGNCVGCPSTMPAMELDRMRHADTGAVLNCDECGRIVIT